MTWNLYDLSIYLYDLSITYWLYNNLMEMYANHLFLCFNFCLKLRLQNQSELALT